MEEKKMSGIFLSFIFFSFTVISPKQPSGDETPAGHALGLRSAA
jgi:hypothetical protein